MARFLAFSVVLATTIAIAIVESRSTAVEVAPIERQYVTRCSNTSLSGLSCANMMVTDLDRLYPHPNDCHMFYACLGTNLPPLCLECPGNLYFDNENNICNYAENVSCRKNSL